MRRRKRGEKVKVKVIIYLRDVAELEEILPKVIKTKEMNPYAEMVIEVRR